MNAPTLRHFARSRPTLSPEMAIRLAWACWSVFLIVPCSFVLWFIWRAGEDQNPLLHSGEEKWFIAAMAYLVLVAPAAFFWREHISSDHRTGKHVSPGTYLVGMIAVWLALLSAGILSLSGCIVIGALVPNVVPAFLSLLLFLMLWPSGKSMMRRVRDRNAPQLHKEHHSAAD